MTNTTHNDPRVTTRLPASVKETLDISRKYFSLARSKGESPRFGNYWRCLLQKAADLTGATLNQFMVQAAVKEAQKLIDAEQVILLSSQDADRIFSLIENPPTPNNHLKEAIQRHQVFFSEKD
mgnify:CR=1 FL=1